MADRPAVAYLVLGRADLLTEHPALHGHDVIFLGRLPKARTGSRPNTVILRWADLDAIELTARTVDGRRQARQSVTGGTLFDALLPGPALRNLAYQVAGEPPAQPPAPLLYAIADGDNLHLYSRVEIAADDACFLHTTTVPTPVDGLDRLDWLRAAFHDHTGLSSSLNSHQCHWRKAFPGQELEHKYTLPDHAPIWALAADTHHRVYAGQLPGFALKHHDELQVWDYLNYLFDIDGPATERGYVSFIPSITTPGWRMKRKWFTTDTFARREQLTDLPPIDGSLDDYVRDVLRLRAHRLPTFRRVRYDVNVESLTTGHYYGIIFDRCHLTEQPADAMTQCEIEYCRTRTTHPPTRPGWNPPRNEPRRDLGRNHPRRLQPARGEIQLLQAVVPPPRRRRPRPDMTEWPLRPPVAGGGGKAGSVLGQEIQSQTHHMPMSLLPGRLSPVPPLRAR